MHSFAGWNCFCNVTPCRVHTMWLKHHTFGSLFTSQSNVSPSLTVFVFSPSLSDVKLVRLNGCAVTCIFRKCATSQCLGWKREHGTSSGFVLWTKQEQDVPLWLLNLYLPLTHWNTPEPWVTNKTQIHKKSQHYHQLNRNNVVTVSNEENKNAVWFIFSHTD